MRRSDALLSAHSSGCPWRESPVGRRLAILLASLLLGLTLRALGLLTARLAPVPGNDRFRGAPRGPEAHRRLDDLARSVIPPSYSTRQACRRGPSTRQAPPGTLQTRSLATRTAACLYRRHTSPRVLRPRRLALRWRFPPVRCRARLSSARAYLRCMPLSIHEGAYTADESIHPIRTVISTAINARTTITAISPIFIVMLPHGSRRPSIPLTAILLASSLRHSPGHPIRLCTKSAFCTKRRDSAQKVGYLSP